MAFLMKSAISFSVALFATAMVVSAIAPPIPNFCATATDKAACNHIVNGATTWPAVMTNGLHIAMRKIRAAKPIVDSIGSKMPGDMWTISKDSIVSACNETYENMVYRTQETLKYVKDPKSFYKGGPGSNFGVISMFTDCQDAMKEFDVKLPEVDNFVDDLSKLATTLISMGDAMP